MRDVEAAAHWRARRDLDAVPRQEPSLDRPGRRVHRHRGRANRGGTAVLPEQADDGTTDGAPPTGSPRRYGRSILGPDPTRQYATNQQCRLGRRHHHLDGTVRQSPVGGSRYRQRSWCSGKERWPSSTKEIGQLHVRRSAGLAFSRLLPTLVGNRLRASTMRFGGVPVGAAQRSEGASRSLGAERS